MKHGHKAVAMAIAVSCCQAGSVRAADDFQANTYKASDGKTLNYRIHLPPQTDQNLKCPLVLFLHGAGERGNDNKKQLVHGAASLLEYSTKSDNPAIIVAPQCPNGMQWVDTPWGADSHTMPTEPSEPMRLVLELLQQIIKERQVDTGRIYVTGISMGGYGTWDIIYRKPEIFAAALPICGGGDTAGAPLMVGLPIWAFHGGADTTVKTKRSRDMIEAIKKAGGKPLYTEYEGVGHNSWTQTYAEPKVMKWLFDQKKKR